ncbi:hypothetical protein [Comamonas serinivorans]|uniref:hypothetical protein n=1 Tax=Comamonas serinivorans TaxID=1082851 RepID=UPI0012FC66F7|nr:hypothetical protein [Comamonas serinivorans]
MSNRAARNWRKRHNRMNRLVFELREVGRSCGVCADLWDFGTRLRIAVRIGEKRYALDVPEPFARVGSGRSKDLRSAAASICAQALAELQA